MWKRGRNPSTKHGNINRFDRRPYRLPLKRNLTNIACPWALVFKKFSDYNVVCVGLGPNSQPLGLETKCIAFGLNSSKTRAWLEPSLSRWCIASLLFYHISSVIDFSPEKYICSTGHKDSWYLQSEFSEDT